MIANYGYKDAEGEFYITVDTDKCAVCAEMPCIPACPNSLLVVEEDPYGVNVVTVDDAKRNQLKYACMECKPSGTRPFLPCVAACPHDAISHSW